MAEAIRTAGAIRCRCQCDTSCGARGASRASRGCARTGRAHATDAACCAASSQHSSLGTERGYRRGACANAANTADIDGRCAHDVDRRSKHGSSSAGLWRERAWTTESHLGVDHRRQHAGARRHHRALHRRRLSPQVCGRARHRPDRVARGRGGARRRRVTCPWMAVTRAPHGLRNDPARRRRRRAVSHRLLRAQALCAAAPGRSVCALVCHRRVVELARRAPGRDRACRGRRCRRLFRADSHVQRVGQSRCALFVLRAVERRYLLRRVVQGLAIIEPAGLRVHVHHRHVVGGDALSPSRFRHDGAVSHRVLPVLRQHRRALRAQAFG